MAGAKLDTVSQYIRRLVVKAAYRDMDDSKLLQRFIAHRDDAAFSTLVCRHGPMVWQVCKNVLHHIQDTEDVFQATFTVLAGNPAQIGKPQSLGSWLHGVALRLALKAKRDKSRREIHEQKAAVMPWGSDASELTWREVRQVLDEEVQRLPEKYRVPFVLCVLEGHTLAEAVRQLKWKEGTVSGRLSVARKRLRERLARRGIEFAAVLGAVTVANEAAGAILPLGLAERTVQAALACPVNPDLAAGFICTYLNNFIQGATNAMSLSTTKLKIIAVLTLVLTALGGWAVRSSRSSSEAEPSQLVANDPAATAARARSVEKEESYSGTVSDAMTGKPVGGLKVFVRRIVNGRPAGQAEFTSEKDGNFRIELPAAWDSGPEAQLAVHVEAPRGYVAFPYRKEMGEDTETGVSLADLRRLQKVGVPPYFHRVLLFPTKEIRGRLETPEGKPAEGIDVVACSVPLKDKATPVHRVLRRMKTDKEGRFTAEVANPGPVVLYFLPERYAARYVKLNDAEGDLGTYKLEEGVEVSGKLRDIRNQALAGRWVRVGTDYGPGADFDLVSVGLGGFARWCRTGPGGTFRTAPLPAGEYVAAAYGADANWDDPLTRTSLMGKERIGEPLDVCIVPKKVVVKPGQTPMVVMQAVPHVNIELRVTDSDGKPKGDIRASYRYVFDGKDYWYGFNHPTVQDGRLTIRVPHGTDRFRVFVHAKEGVCRIRKPGNDPNLLGADILLRKLEADRTLDYIWTPCIDASLKLCDKKGAPLTDVDLDIRQGPMEPNGYMQVRDGIYWIASVQPKLPLYIHAKADGYQKVDKEVKLADNASRCIEITLEKKK
jgi:RNA polymerase sigma factor (sigma-70 family)